MAADFAEAAYLEEAAALYKALPPDRPRPPEDAEVAYAELTGQGVDLPNGSRVVLRPVGEEGGEGELEAIRPLLESLCAEWLAVAVRAITEAHLCDLLCELTEGGGAAAAGASPPPRCEERVALAQAVLDGIVGRPGGDVRAFLQQRCAKSARFIVSIRNCTAVPEDAPFFEYWLQVSTRYGGRTSDGRLQRVFHGVLFEDKTLAVEAARIGNLDVLKALDRDGYDVRRRVGGTCCGGGQQAYSVARKNGHQECAVWIDELKLYPKVLTY